VVIQVYAGECMPSVDQAQSIPTLKWSLCPVLPGLSH